MNDRIALVMSLGLLAACGGGTSSGNAPATAASGAPVVAPSTAAQAADVEADTADGDTPPAGSSAAPCALVTAAEASEVMGHGMKQGEAAKASECLYVSASGDTTKSVTFESVPGTEVFDAMSKSGQPVSGIGDRAAVLPVSNLIVAVKNGRTFMGGVYDGASPTTVKDRSMALAKKAVARM